MLLRVMRILRILRILRLVQGSKQLRKILESVILSFPALGNVAMMMALVTYMYSIIGINMFTFLVRQGSLNEDRNFDTVGSSALVLFQCMTGDGWSAMMLDAMISEKSGLCSEAADNCGSPAALPFFLSYQV